MPEGGPKCCCGIIPAAPGEALEGISPPIRTPIIPVLVAASPGGIRPLSPPIGSTGMPVNAPGLLDSRLLCFFLLFLEGRGRPSFSPPHRPVGGHGPDVSTPQPGCALIETIPYASMCTCGVDGARTCTGCASRELTHMPSAHATLGAQPIASIAPSPTRPEGVVVACTDAPAEFSDWVDGARRGWREGSFIACVGFGVIDGMLLRL